VRRALLTLSVLSLSTITLMPTGVAQGVPVPVVASDNIDVLLTLPDVTAISTAFDPTRPFMYVNTVNGISTYDISNPAMPILEGALPMPHFENEAMAVGQRADGTTFLLVGVDIFSVTPTHSGSPAHITGGSAEHLIVVDVTNPAAPAIRSQIDTSSSTHTVQCVNPACTFAYTSGAYNNKTFHLIDLTNLNAPVQLGALTNHAGGGPVSIGGHQWDHDDAGVMWVSSGGGLAAYDVTDPADPKILQSTNAKGNQGPYNNFVIHNSYRPNGDDYVQVRDEATGRLTHPGSPETASVFNGDVALVTEEDYDSPVCGGDAGEGTFSTWYIPYMENEQFMAKHPAPNGHNGDMVPLDNWNSEVLNTGMRTPAGALCSAHYFTFHDSGFIAQAWYQQGTRILDVRNPRDIKQVGYFFTGASETWHAYWVPERDAQGKVTGKDTNIVYTNDVARGIDVLRVTLPITPPGDTDPIRAPILPQWLTGTFTSSAPSSKFGYLCRQIGTLRTA
jgi:hypothetical protein